MCTAIKLRSADEPGVGTTQRIILGELMKLPIEAYPRGIPVVELAQRLGCSDRQIRRAVCALADRGLVALVKESRPGRQGQSLMVWSSCTYEGWMNFTYAARIQARRLARVEQQMLGASPTR